MRDSPSPADQRWTEIANPRVQATILRGVVRMAMNMGLSLEMAGQALLDIPDEAANGLAYTFGGVPDGASIRAIGHALKMDDA